MSTGFTIWPCCWSQSIILSTSSCSDLDAQFDIRMASALFTNSDDYATYVFVLFCILPVCIPCNLDQMSFARISIILAEIVKTRTSSRPCLCNQQDKSIEVGMT